MRVFSLDAETNGLYGQPFAIAALVTDDSGELDTFVARIPIEGKVDEWVEENVIPQLTDMPITHQSYTSMLNDFYQFYSKYQKDSHIIGHIVHPVESKLLRDMIELNLDDRQWKGPFPLIDVSSVLLAKRTRS